MDDEAAAMMIHYDGLIADEKHARFRSGCRSLVAMVIFNIVCDEVRS